MSVPFNARLPHHSTDRPPRACGYSAPSGMRGPAGDLAPRLRSERDMACRLGRAHPGLRRGDTRLTSFPPGRGARVTTFGTREKAWVAGGSEWETTPGRASSRAPYLIHRAAMVTAIVRFVVWGGVVWTRLRQGAHDQAARITHPGVQDPRSRRRRHPGDLHRLVPDDP